MEQSAKKPSILNNYYVRIIGTLLVITAVVAALLAGVNALTQGPIQANAAREKEQAIAEVMQGAAGFDALEVPAELAGDVVDLLRAKDQNGNPMGYCVETSTNGNDDKIRLMVGVDLTGAVTKVCILEQHETAGVSHQGELAERFTGLSGSVALTDSGPADHYVDAISGATYTSAGVVKGVNSALAAVGTYMEGGAR